MVDREEDRSHHKLKDKNSQEHGKFSFGSLQLPTNCTEAQNFQTQTPSSAFVAIT
jgi:hypothetical protein